MDRRNPSSISAINTDLKDNTAEIKIKKPVIAKQEIQTSEGLVTKHTLPYLDWRIDPRELDFNEDDPTNSAATKGRTIKYNGKEYLVYNAWTPQRISEIDNQNFFGYLGEGGFGTVYLAQDKQTKEWIAIKEPTHGSVYTPEELEKEAEDLKKEVSKLKQTDNFVFFDEKMKAIGMKLAEGHQLFEKMGKSSPIVSSQFAPLQKIVIAKSILKNMADLHHDVKHMKGEKNKKEILFHRDIKGNNIGVNPSTLTVKYIDFGLARSFEEQKPVPILSRIRALLRISPKVNLKDTRPTAGEIEDSARGTLPYMAPELYKVMKVKLQKYNKGSVIDPRLDKVQYTEKTEVFALGVTLAILFGKAKPDPNDSYRFIFDKPKNIDPNNIDKDLDTLISYMLHDDPKKRPTVVVATKYLNQIFHDMAEKDSINVCVISIDDFIQYDDSAKSTLIKKIKNENMNAVVLQGSNTTTNADYYDVRFELSQLGIISVAPFIAKGDDQDAINRVAKDHYDQRLATINTKVFNYDPKQNEFEDKTKEAQAVQVQSIQNNSAKTMHSSSTGPSEIQQSPPEFNNNIASTKQTSPEIKKERGPFLKRMSTVGRVATRAISSMTVELGVASKKMIFGKKEIKNDFNTSLDDKILSHENPLYKAKYEENKLYQPKKDLSENMSTSHLHEVHQTPYTNQSLFNKKEDTDKVINFLKEKIEFFADLLKEDSSKVWWKLDGKSLDHLSQLNDELTHALNKHEESRGFLMESLFGEEEKDPDALQNNGRQVIKAYLKDYPEVVIALHNHIDNPAIDAWFKKKEEEEQESRGDRPS